MKHIKALLKGVVHVGKAPGYERTRDRKWKEVFILWGNDEL